MFESSVGEMCSIEQDDSIGLPEKATMSRNWEIAKELVMQPPRKGQKEIPV